MQSCTLCWVYVTSCDDSIAIRLMKGRAACVGQAKQGGQRKERGEEKVYHG